VTARDEQLVGVVVRLSPTAVVNWSRCRRMFRNRHLLRLPVVGGRVGGEVDATGLDSSGRGQLLHALLQRVHERGDCHDHRFVTELVESNVPGEPGAWLAAMARHADRCPRGATAVGHEMELTRFQRRPGPMLLVTGRIDAVWEHDGLLDARDYKSGPPATQRVADDLQARVQAWLLEPEAARRGLRLRLRYEHLGDDGDDPEPWDPDGDEMRAVEADLVALAADVRAGPYPGIAEPAVCRWCDWRATCDESAWVDDQVDQIGQIDDRPEGGATA
jgi:hypothetical protein